MSDPKHVIDPFEFWHAVDVYLQVAYEKVPAAVQKKIDHLKTLSEADLYLSREFESPPKSANAVAQDEIPPLIIRLGNRFYPHMKLKIQRSPDGKGVLLAADTHDQHTCPKPDSPHFAAYQVLMQNNKTIANAIEAQWVREGLNTFKTYLKKKLDQKIYDKYGEDFSI